MSRSRLALLLSVLVVFTLAASAHAVTWIRINGQADVVLDVGEPMVMTMDCNPGGEVLVAPVADFNGNGVYDPGADEIMDSGWICQDGSSVDEDARAGYFQQTELPEPETLVGRRFLLVARELPAGNLATCQGVFQLPVTAQGVRGHVSNPDGTPAVSTSVWAVNVHGIERYEYDDLDGEMWASLTDENGDFVVYVPRGGNYAAALGEPEAVLCRREVYIPNGAFVEGINFDLPVPQPPCPEQTVTVSGSVTDSLGQTLPFVQVTCFDQWWNELAGTHTDLQGAYSISVRPGQYRYEIELGGYVANAQYSPNVTQDTTLNMQMHRAQCRVEGVVRDATTGQAVPGAGVYVRQNVSPYHSEWCDSSPSGRYLLWTDPGASSLNVETEGSDYEHLSQSVTVSGTMTVDLALIQRSGTLSGRVTDDRGQSVPWACVQALNRTRPWSATPTTYTNPDGTYSLALTPGDGYDITFGLLNGWSTADYQDVTLAAAETRVLDQQLHYVSDPPVLSNGHVTPASGDSTTPYVFQVTYSDPNNDAPAYVAVSWDGNQTWHGMVSADQSDTDYTDGAVYECWTLLPGGSYSYVFTAVDSNYADARLGDREPMVSYGPCVVTVTATNDLCADAAPIDPGSIWTVDLTGATTSDGEPSGCSGSQHTVWYSFSTATRGLAVFDTEPYDNPVLPAVDVYEGGCDPGLCWDVGSASSSATLRSIYLPDAASGWVVGDGGYIESYHGVHNSGTAQDLLSVFALDGDLCWAAGNAGTIVRTTDAGSTWSPLASGVSVALRDIKFRNTLEGMAVGDAGTIIVTSDGTSWAGMASGVAANLRSIGGIPPDRSIAFAVGDSGTVLQNTRPNPDWTAVAVPATQTLYSIAFADATTGWIVGAGGTILKTEDGGSTWVLQTSGTAENLHGVQPVGMLECWAVGANGTILHTTDGGQNWVVAPFGSTNDLYSVSLSDPDFGYACGVGGVIAVVGPCEPEHIACGTYSTRFIAQPGVNYLIRLGVDPDGVGLVNASFEFTPCMGPPDNDECGNARTVTCPYTDTQDVTCATTASDDPVVGNGQPGQSIWYRYTAAEDGHLRIIVTGTGVFPTLDVFSGGCGSTQLVESDWWEDRTVVISVSAGETYLIRAGSFIAQAGTIQVSCEVVDITPPQVVSTDPENGAPGVAVNTRISVAFSEALSPSTVNTETFRLTDELGGLIPGSVQYEPSTQSAIFTPTTALPLNTGFTATLTTGVQDSAGNPPASDYVWSFRTGSVAFIEDFSDPLHVEANWSPYGSAFAVSDGIGTQSPDGSVAPVHPNHKATLHDKGLAPTVFGDLIYTADVKMTGDARTMLCFGSDTAGRRFWVGYDIADGQIWCVNDLWNDGRVAGTVSIVDDYRPYDGQWHRWRVEVRGSNVDFYVDAHHVLTGQLEGYLPGPIGMRCWDGGGSQFDNVTVAPPRHFTRTVVGTGVVQATVVADVDDDGTPELVVACPADKSVRIYDQAAQLSYELAFDEAPFSLAVGDTDGDGHTELVVGTLESYVSDVAGHVSVGEVSSGSFTQEWVSEPCYIRFADELTLADMDGNGRPEIVAGLTWWDRCLRAYEFQDGAYQVIYSESISDTNCVFASGNMLLVGTGCWWDYGLRVYGPNYELQFADTGDGLTCASASDVDGDSQVEIVRGTGTQCGGTWYPDPVVQVYEQIGPGDWTVSWTSPPLAPAYDRYVEVATGNLTPAGGDEIAVGTHRHAGEPASQTMRMYASADSSYSEFWRMDIPDPNELVSCVRVADLDLDGYNELYASTTSGLWVFRNAAPYDTRPETWITAGPQEDGVVTSLPVVFEWSGWDDITPAGSLSYSHRIDGLEWTAFGTAMSASYDVLSDGQHVFEVKARDQSGTEDPTPAIRRFLVENTPPAVVSTYPSDGAARVSLNSPIRAAFSECMDPVTINDGTFIVQDSAGTPVPGNVTYDVATRTAVFQPAALFTVCAPYTARIATGVKDLSGKPLQSEYTWSFTTEGQRVFNVADMVMDSMTEEPDPTIWDVVRQSELKPPAWEFANPHNNEPWSPWRTNLSALSAQQLSDYDLAFISSHTLTAFSDADRDKLRDWVSGGGLLWIDDCGDMHPQNFFEPFDFAGDGWLPDGSKGTEQSGHAFFSSLYVIPQDELSHLGNPGYSGHVVGYDSAKWLELLYNVNGDERAPDILCMQHDSGQVMVTADDYGCSLEGGESEDLKFCYNVFSVLGSGADLRAPNTFITSGPADGETWCSASIAFAWTVSDNATPPDQLLCSWRMDGGDWSPASATTGQVFEGLSPGPHVFEVKAVDAAGNGEQTPAVRSFTLDPFPPVISAVSAAPGDADCTITWVTDEPATSQVEYGPTSAYGSATPLDETLVIEHSVYIPSLAPGSSYHFRVLSMDTCGQAHLAMSDDRVVSTSPVPDLRVTEIAGPADAVTGQEIEVSWTVTNAGTAAATGEWVDRVFLSDDDQIGNDVILNPASFPYSSGLAQGTSVARTQAVTIPLSDLPAGDYHLVVATDADGGINETLGEDNNILMDDAPIHIVAAALPDLFLPEVTAPPSAYAGQVGIRIAWQVNNQGTGSTNMDQWNDHVYLSTDTTPDSNDVDLGEVDNPSYLGIGESYLSYCDFNVPGDLQGTYYAIVVTDSGRRVVELSETNNTAASSQIQVTAPVPPDLQTVGVLAPETVESGGTMRVDWRVRNAGSGPTAISSWSDAIFLSSDTTFDPGSDELLGSFSHEGTLNPGDEYSSSQEVTVPYGTRGSRYVFVLVDSGNQVVERAWEGNNSGYDGPVDVIYNPPDLEVTGVTAPASGMSADTVSLSWTVKNFGPSEVGWTHWRDKVYLSTDSTLSPATDLLLWEAERYGSLAVDEQYTRHCEPRLPAQLTGSFRVIVHTDADDRLPEVSESNNILACAATTTITQRQCDLAVTSADASATGLVGETITISWTVANAGTHGTPPDAWTDSIYLSTDQVLDTSDYFVASYGHPGGLGAAQSYSASERPRLPSVPVGSYYLFVLTDSDGIVYEHGAESNNSRLCSSPIAIAIEYPDLQVTSVSAPETGDSGKWISVRWWVANKGRVGTGVSQWWDSVYLSTDNVLSPETDVLLDEYAHDGALTQEGPLPMGGSPGTNSLAPMLTLPLQSWLYSRSETLKLPNGIEGTYYVLVATDSYDAVDEGASEGNNVGHDAVPMQVSLTPWPDLTIAQVDAPASCNFGDNLTINWLVQNAGPGPTAETEWTDWVYLSSDDVLGDGDQLLRQVSHSGTLASAGSYPAMVSFPVPLGLTGTYYVFVVTDANGQVFEHTGEGNNTGRDAEPVQLTRPPLPDLQVASVTAPETGLAGQPLSVAWTVTNPGDGPTHVITWYDAVYLSRDMVLDTTDPKVGYLEHTSVLAAAGSYDANLQVTIPSYASGPYYLIVQTDSTGVVYEYDHENNNTGHTLPPTVIVVPPPPDLVVSQVALAGPAIPSEPVTVNFSVANQGNSSALGQWYDSVYLSSDETWDVDDRPLGTVLHQGDVAAASGYAGSLTTSLPGMTPGAYHFIVRADIRNNLRETNESNNVGVSVDTVDIGMTELQLGVAYPCQLSTGVDQYYRVSVPSGEDLLITLDGSCPTGANEMYVRYGAAPDLGHYDYMYDAPFMPDQKITVPGTQAGYYYVLVRGAYVPEGCEACTIKAELLQFHVARVTPDQAGNTGPVTVCIEGGRFTQDMTACLKSAGGQPICARDLYFDSGTRAFATFDLKACALGTYDLELKTATETATKPSALRVVTGLGGRLLVNVAMPPALRPGLDYVCWVQYGNAGDADIAAPLLVLSSPQDVLMRLSTREPYAPGPVQVLGISFDQPAGVLRPGEWGAIPLYFRATATNVVEIKVDQAIADSSPVDWASIEPEVRPDDMDAGGWSVIWANLTSQIGSTWADYVEALDGNATHLALNGERTYDVRKLLGLEIAKASAALNPEGVLAASVDAYSSARGLPLAFARVAPVSIDQRFRIGPFGRGWSHNYEYRLGYPDHTDVNRVVISGPAGAKRTFTRYAGGGWQGELGDSATLYQNAYGYELREKTGLVWYFDPSGVLVSVEEPNGNLISLFYDSGRLVRAVHTNGQSLTLSYNAAGRIAGLTDHSGRVTQYQYDAAGEHLIGVASPDGVITYSYGSFGGVAGDHSLQAITYPDMTHQYYSYDACGRLANEWRDAGTGALSFTYDEPARVEVRDGLGAASILQMGASGQILTALDPLGRRTRTETDDDRTYSRLIAPSGGVWEWMYDARGNVTLSRDALGQAVQLGHTANFSRLDWLRDPRGNPMDFLSDGRGNLTGIRYADGSAEAFGYDGQGNLSSVLNRRGASITFAHDAEGRVTSKTYPDGRTIAYSYDGRANLIGAADSATGSIVMRYDARDYLIRIEYPDGKWLAFDYDNAGRRTRRTSHDGYAQNYLYDVSGRLQRITDGTGFEIIGYEYDAQDRLIRETKGNGTYTTYAYDAAGQVIQVVNCGAGGGSLSSFVYTYDANGNPTSMTTLAGTTTYRYDAIGQLTGVAYPNGRVVSYSYDPSGNRVSVVDNGAVTPYTTNNMNQYTSAGGVTYSYDADGNMTYQTGASGATYEYDAENRLITVMSSDGHTWRYVYDALGNRASTEYDGTVTRYVNDPFGLVDVAAEYAGDGTLKARYVHGMGLAARIDPAGMGAYYNFDAIGHTRQITDAVGNVANTYDYDPFGMPLQITETISNPFRYVGRFGVADEANGLLCMRARYYSLGLGRFCMADPVGCYGSANLYLYVGNAPLKWVDPQGLWKWRNWWLDPTRAVYHGRWLGKYRSGGRTTEPGKLGDLSVGAIGLADEASKFHDWLHYRGVKGAAGHALTYMLERWLETGQPWGFWEDAFLLSGDTIDAGLVEDPVNSKKPYDDLVREFLEDVAKAQKGRGVAGGSAPVIRPVDPNDKIGPRGYGPAGFVPADSDLPYVINFENVSTATAPAQRVRVTDQLDEDLDWRTFRLGEIVFGDHHVPVPSGRCFYQTRISLGEEHGNILADVTAGINIQTGLLTWTIVAIDPNTGEPPMDVRIGLLPPNDETHRGEGHVTYTVKPKSNLQTTTQITNKATIIFDIHEPIETNTVTNTLDAVAPTSSVEPLPAQVDSVTFPVSWSGSDDAGGSGLKSFDVYCSDNDGPFAVWQNGGGWTTAEFTGEMGHSYRFYSIARDNAGNVESAPGVPDASTNVVNLCPSGPSPADQATDVSVLTALAWTPGYGATSHDLYLWKGTTKPESPTATGLANTYQPTNPLDFGADYHWQVTAKGGSGGDCEGTEWTFSTVAAPGAKTICDAKKQADGTWVSVPDVVVSARFTEPAPVGRYFYVEQPDRSAGIRVVWDWEGTGAPSPAQGVVNIIGQLATTAPDLERYILASHVVDAGVGVPVSLGTGIRGVGGSAFAYDPVTGAGQSGVKACVPTRVDDLWQCLPADVRALNNIGLLITTWGKVTYVDAGGFYLDDGSGCQESPGTPVGARVIGTVPVGQGEDAVGRRVEVTGISSCRESGGIIYQLIRSTNVRLVD